MKIQKSFVFAAMMALSLSVQARHNGNGNNGGNQPPPTNGTVPECMDNGSVLEIDNNQVLQWESTSKNQFRARAHVQGQVEEMFPDATGHRHFALQIGSSVNDHIEIIYNLSFGNMPVKVGDQVEACGDYITANAPSGGYPASPDGALLHWVHRSTAGHDGGFVTVNGQLYGQGNGSGN